MRIGFFGSLGLIFVVLKLTGNIDWSWWLVLLPLYGGYVLILVITALYGLIVGGTEVINAAKNIGKRGK